MFIIKLVFELCYFYSTLKLYFSRFTLIGYLHRNMQISKESPNWKIHRKTPESQSFFNKVAGFYLPRNHQKTYAILYKTETSTQVFSCEFLLGRLIFPKVFPIIKQYYKKAKQTIEKLFK